MNRKACGRLLLCVAAILISVFLLNKMIYNGCFIFDRSATAGAESLEWNNVIYRPCDGAYTGEGRVLAKTVDGRKIKAVEEDDTHSFVVVRSFTDQQMFVREDYDIPESGKVTSICWKRNWIDDAELCAAIEDILSSGGETFELRTQGIFMRTEVQRLGSVYLAYEGCPVTTEYKGYMGKLEGRWVITTDISDPYYAEGKRWYDVEYRVVDEQFASVLEPYYEIL